MKCKAARHDVCLGLMKVESDKLESGFARPSTEWMVKSGGIMAQMTSRNMTRRWMVNYVEGKRIEKPMENGNKKYPCRDYRVESVVGNISVKRRGCQGNSKEGGVCLLYHG